VFFNHSIFNVKNDMVSVNNYFILINDYKLKVGVCVCEVGGGWWHKKTKDWLNFLYLIN